MEDQKNEPSAAKVRLTSSLQKKRKKQQRDLQKMVETYQQNNRKAVKRQQDKLDLLKRQLGKEDFNALKSVCMVQVPEQKDSEGKVIQEAKTVLNKQALIVEASHLLVMLREERIKKGIRKRGTGRSSDRKSHKSMINFLNRRNKEAGVEPVSATARRR